MSRPIHLPPILETLAELRDTLSEMRHAQKRIGFVPTMGALHEGHLSLVRASQAECGVTVVSIYVNPTQFGPHEDFSRYPRTLDFDLHALATCDRTPLLVFLPKNESMYPEGFSTWVEPGPVAEPWEGQIRPGHFRGVATVVLKLFNMVGPDIAYFGQKDYQQATLIRRMVDDLNLPVKIRVRPTVREPDGLAMSSRNRYLSPEDRQRALVLWKSLCLAKELVASGQRDAATIVAQMEDLIRTVPEARIDYVALVDPDTLASVAQVHGRTAALIAVKLGATRLIDNAVLDPTGI
jgi:pantoate--beta-alanine ligase